MEKVCFTTEHGRKETHATVKVGGKNLSEDKILEITKLDLKLRVVGVRDRFGIDRRRSGSEFGAEWPSFRGRPTLAVYETEY